MVMVVVQRWWVGIVDGGGVVEEQVVGCWQRPNQTSAFADIRFGHHWPQED